MKIKTLALLITLSLILIVSNSTNILALDKTGLVLFLPLDEGKGDTAEDVSGMGNDGDIQDNAKWVDGHEGKGLQLDATEDRIIVEDSESLDIEQDITMEIWAIVEGLPDGSCAFFQKPTAYMLHTTTGGNGVKIDPLVFIGGSYGTWPTPANAIGSMSEWHHWAATYDGTGYKIYVDGELADEYERSPDGPIDQDDNPLAIGRDNRDGCNTRNMPCIIDMPRVWNRALSEAEIKEAMSDNLMAVQLEGKLSTCWGRLKQD